jgi:hypothetical protein
MNVLFLSDSYTSTSTWDPFRQRIVDTLASAVPNFMAVKANLFFHSSSGVYRSDAHQQAFARVVQTFQPDVVFSINRAGLTPDTYALLPPHTIILNTFADSYQILPDGLMQFTDNDRVFLYFIPEAHAHFIKQYRVNPAHVHFATYGVDTDVFYPHAVEKSTNVFFAGSAFGNAMFTWLLSELAPYETLRQSFLAAYNAHNTHYLDNFQQALITRFGFNKETLQTRQLKPFDGYFTVQDLVQNAPLLQNTVDHQLSFEKRVQCLSAVADLGLVFYGEPIDSWIQAIGLVNSQLFQSYQFNAITTPTALARQYSQAKMTLNIGHYQNSHKGLPWRVFEAFACQSLLITSADTKKPLEAMHFVEGEDFITYRTLDELKDRCAWYLAHDSQREAIAKRAYAKAFPAFALKNRLSHIFTLAGFNTLAKQLDTCAVEPCPTAACVDAAAVDALLQAAASAAVPEISPAPADTVVMKTKLWGPYRLNIVKKHG